MSLIRTAVARGSPRIVFLNPGEPFDRGAGPYWSMVAQSMISAANSFGMELEVLYGERDHLRMLRQAQEVALRPNPPEYVVIVNEKSAAPQMFRMFNGSPAKILLLHNDLTKAQRQEIGNEREKIQNWIGTVTTNARRAAFLLMERLYQRLGDRDPQIIGITGDPNTPVSLERADGVQDYVSHARRGRINQLAFGDWTRDDGEHKAAILLARYPDSNIIWAANDTMALGALSAVKASGASVLVGGMGGWPEALVSVADGGLTATAAGNFIVGSFAMVLLYDYHHGQDFAAHGGVHQELEYLIVDRENVAQFNKAVMERLNSMNFRRYSKVLNPTPGPYDFNLKDLVASRQEP